MFLRLLPVVVVAALFGCQTVQPPAEASVEGDAMEAGIATPKTLIRLSPDGPADGADNRAAARGNRVKTYYAAPTSNVVSVGTWQADPEQTALALAGYCQFLYIVNGSAKLADEHGREEVFEAGDAVIIPRGVKHAWKQPQALSGYRVIFDEGKPDDWADRTAVDSFIRFEAYGPEETLKGEGNERGHAYYSARGGALSAGVWKADTWPSDSFYQSDYTEFMCVLEGSVILIDAAGNEERVKAGEAVVIPKGMRYEWRQDEPIRKYWVIFDADQPD